MRLQGALEYLSVMIFAIIIIIVIGYWFSLSELSTDSRPTQLTVMYTSSYRIGLISYSLTSEGNFTLSLINRDREWARITSIQLHNKTFSTAIDIDPGENVNYAGSIDISETVGRDYEWPLKLTYEINDNSHTIITVLKGFYE